MSALLLLPAQAAGTLLVRPVSPGTRSPGRPQPGAGLFSHSRDQPGTAPLAAGVRGGLLHVPAQGIGGLHVLLVHLAAGVLGLEQLLPIRTVRATGNYGTWPSAVPLSGFTNELAADRNQSDVIAGLEPAAGEAGHGGAGEPGQAVAADVCRF
jgi:hypothetical protein